MSANTHTRTQTDDTRGEIIKGRKEERKKERGLISCIRIKMLLLLLSRQQASKTTQLYSLLTSQLHCFSLTDSSLFLSLVRTVCVTSDTRVQARK